MSEVRFAGQLARRLCFFNASSLYTASIKSFSSFVFQLKALNLIPPGMSGYDIQKLLSGSFFKRT